LGPGGPNFQLQSKQCYVCKYKAQCAMLVNKGANSALLEKKIIFFYIDFLKLM